MEGEENLDPVLWEKGIRKIDSDEIVISGKSEQFRSQNDSNNDKNLNLERITSKNSNQKENEGQEYDEGDLLLLSNDEDRKRVDLYELINSRLPNSKSKSLFIQLYNSLIINEDQMTINKEPICHNVLQNKNINQDTFSNNKFVGRIKELEYDKLVQLNVENSKKYNEQVNNPSITRVIETMEKIEKKQNISSKFKNKLSDIFKSNFNVSDNKSKNKLVKEIESKIKFENKGDKEVISIDKLSTKKSEIFKILSKNNSFRSGSSIGNSSKIRTIMGSNTIERDENITLNTYLKGKNNINEDDRFKDWNKVINNPNKFNSVRGKFDKILGEIGKKK